MRNVKENLSTFSFVDYLYIWNIQILICESFAVVCRLISLAVLVEVSLKFVKKEQHPLLSHTLKFTTFVPSAVFPALFHCSQSPNLNESFA